MPQLGQNVNGHISIRRTEVKSGLTPETMSPLGRELTKIAAEIEASDEKPMDEDTFERELIRRRGGPSEDGE